MEHRRETQLAQAERDCCDATTPEQRVEPTSFCRASLPPPLPPRKPPRLPSREKLFAPPPPTQVAGSSTAVVLDHDVGTRKNDFPEEVLAASHNDELDRRCLELAKLMLSPDGLPLKKVTLEGFSIPVALRLMEHPPPMSAMLTVTWIEHDNFGFDLRGLRLNTVGRGSCLPDPGLAERMERTTLSAGCVESRGGGGGSGACRRDDSRVLVLSWSSGAEVVLEAGSREQRDLLARCIDLLVSDLVRLDGAIRPTASTTTEGNGGAHLASQEKSDAADSKGCGEGDGARDCVKQEHACPVGAGAGCLAPFNDAGAADGKDGADTGAWSTVTPLSHRRASSSGYLSAGDVSRRRRTLGPRAPEESRCAARDPDLSGSDTGSDDGNSNNNGCMMRARRGASLSPRRGRRAGLAEQRRRDSERERNREEAGHRRRLEGTMVRLLAVYDRANDESRAAAWRAGVSFYFNVAGGGFG